MQLRTPRLPQACQDRRARLANPVALDFGAHDLILRNFTFARLDSDDFIL